MKTGHWSDCAVHNEPALPEGPCDCGGLDLADDSRHGLVATTVSRPGSEGLFVQEREGAGLVEPQQLPADGFIVNAATSDLPDPHDGVSVLGEAASVDLNVACETVVTDLKKTP